MRILICLYIILSILLPASTSYSDTDSSWYQLMDGIQKYKTESALREEFDQLCEESDTATIDGRVDTGDGLYMEVDVAVYRQPDISKIATLKNQTRVVLTGETESTSATEWVKIKFLQISSYSNMAIDIVEGWIEKSFIK